jgi:hypothetical protein
MTDAAPPPLQTPATGRPSRKRIVILAGVAAGSALATVHVMLLWLNIHER